MSHSESGPEIIDVERGRRISISKGIELSAFQVQVPTEFPYNIWITPERGLALLYGKNGTYKTTIIDALIELLVVQVPEVVVERSQHRWGDGAQGFIDLDHSLVLHHLLHETSEDFGQFRWTALGGNKTSGRPQDPRTIEKDFEFYYTQRIEPRWAEEHEADEHEQEFRLALKFWLSSTFSTWGEEPTEYLSGIFGNLRDRLKSDFLTGRSRYTSLRECEESLNRFGISLLDSFELNDESALDQESIPVSAIEALDWEGLTKLELFQWLSEIDNILETEDQKQQCYVIFEAVENGIIEDRDDLKLKDLLQDPYFFHRLIVESFEHLIQSPSFSFSRSADGKFEINFAVPLNGEASPNLQSFLQCPFDDLGAGNDAKELAARQSLLWQQSFVYRVEEKRSHRVNGDCHLEVDTESKYVRLDPFSPIAKVRRPPIEGIALDHLEPPEALAKAALIEAVTTSDSEASVLLDNHRRKSDYADVSSIDLADFKLKVAAATQLLQQFDLGVTDISVDLSTWLQSWAKGEAITVKFLTSGSTDKGINFSNLSGAQRYWTNVALAIAKEEGRITPVIFLADEPDAGLHERAAHRAFSTLSGLGINALVVSHSVSALRQQSAALIHLERDSRGQVVPVPVGLGADVNEAAERLGTSTFDLLALKRLLVVVEGAHDAVIVERLLGLSRRHNLLDSSLVVPARGVRNVAHAADSLIVTEFTEMEILAVVDNGRYEVLTAMLNEARSLVQEGRPRNKIAKSLLAQQATLNPTPEERFMFDLIVRSVERGISHRVHVFGLPVKDIIELLPETSFGLESPWPVLRQEYDRRKERSDFKSWLRDVYSAEISTRRISEAFGGMDALPSTLIDLLREIEILSSLGALN